MSDLLKTDEIDSILDVAEHVQFPFEMIDVAKTQLAALKARVGELEVENDKIKTVLNRIRDWA